MTVIKAARLPTIYKCLINSVTSNGGMLRRRCSGSGSALFNSLTSWSQAYWWIWDIENCWYCTWFQPLSDWWLNELTVFKVNWTKATVVIQVRRVIFKKYIQVCPTAVNKPHLASETKQKANWAFLFKKTLLLQVLSCCGDQCDKVTHCDVLDLIDQTQVIKYTQLI